jgi:hypothetical protein
VRLSIPAFSNEVKERKEGKKRERKILPFLSLWQHYLMTIGIIRSVYVNVKEERERKRQERERDIDIKRERENVCIK